MNRKNFGLDHLKPLDNQYIVCKKGWLVTMGDRAKDHRRYVCDWLGWHGCVRFDF